MPINPRSIPGGGRGEHRGCQCPLHPYLVGKCPGNRADLLDDEGHADGFAVFVDEGMKLVSADHVNCSCHERGAENDGEAFFFFDQSYPFLLVIHEPLGHEQEDAYTIIAQLVAVR